MRPLPLLTPRLILRPFTADDLPHFTAYRSHPDAVSYTHLTLPTICSV